MVSNLPCCCFAYRAGYCDYLEAALPPVFSDKIAEGFYGIADLEYGLVGKSGIIEFSLDDGTNGPLGKSISNVIVAIKTFPLDSKEAVASLGSPRISTHARERR
jgi:hypothetical protein